MQDKFQKQEDVVKELQSENRVLQKRIQQYEKCLDDVTKKVIDAIINEDRLRAEVGILKDRVLDLEAQTALPPPPLTGSPAKGRDEGYCTMPPTSSTLENLPEEPEQYLIATCSSFNCCSSDGIAEPCTAEMEDWSLSQEDVGATITLEDDWIWKEATSINAPPPPIDAEHANLLENPIVYSDDDDELVCKEFTSDYYRLVNLKSESNKSLVLENDNNEFNPLSSDDCSERGDHQQRHHRRTHPGCDEDGDHCNDEDSEEEEEEDADVEDEEEEEEDCSQRNRSVVEKKNELNVRTMTSPTASEKGRQNVFR